MANKIPLRLYLIFWLNYNVESGSQSAKSGNKKLDIVAIFIDIFISPGLRKAGALALSFHT